mmetsp:Transcript_13005/g.37093  ORF Transcript_13005/g.37093 Transcript_13005/m.37093 type:complete len:189 (+) Transcript_13005:470-1036(+)
MLARLYELMDQRIALHSSLQEIASEQNDNHRRVEREIDEIDAFERKILDAEAARRRLRPGSRKLNLTQSNNKTHLRILVKNNKALKKRVDEAGRRFDQVRETWKGNGITFCELQRVMASNGGEYMKLLERAYKAKRCAHCFCEAFEEEDGEKKTFRCSHCKAALLQRRLPSCRLGCAPTFVPEFEGAS